MGEERPSSNVAEGACQLPWLPTSATGHGCHDPATEFPQAHERSSASAVKSRHGIASYSGVASAADGQLRRPSGSQPVIGFLPVYRSSLAYAALPCWATDRRGSPVRDLLVGVLAGRPEGSSLSGLGGRAPSRWTKGRPRDHLTGEGLSGRGGQKKRPATVRRPPVQDRVPLERDPNGSFR